MIEPRVRIHYAILLVMGKIKSVIIGRDRTANLEYTFRCTEQYRIVNIFTSAEQSQVHRIIDCMKGAGSLNQGRVDRP